MRALPALVEPPSIPADCSLAGVASSAAHRAWNDLGRRPPIARMIEVALAGGHPAELVTPGRTTGAVAEPRVPLRALLSGSDPARPILRLELSPVELRAAEPYGCVLERVRQAQHRLRRSRPELSPSAALLLDDARLLLAEGRTLFRAHDLAAALLIARTVAAVHGHSTIAADDLGEAIVYRNHAPEHVSCPTRP